MSRRSPCRGALLCVAIAGSLTACTRAPAARPLDASALLAAVRSERAPARTEGRLLTLTDAAARLRATNPEVREARTVWTIADAVARTKTPPPNPTISLGPLLLGGSDVLSHATWGFELAMGWIVPIASPPRLADDLNRVRAGAAFARAAAVERAAYLELRGAYAGAILAAEGADVHGALADAARAAAKAGLLMAEAGQATAVDVRLLELDAERADATRLTAAAVAVHDLHDVAARIGLDATTVLLPTSDGLPPLPGEVPDLAELERGTMEGHPALDVLRAEYLVAEKELRLEAAAANPNIEIGAGLEREPPDSRIGLPLAFELPIFDRNQVGIARARAARDAVRERYRAELQRRLSAIATARADLEGKRAVLEALETRVRPAAARTLEAARDGLEVGSIDALRYLEAVRAERSAAVDIVDARRAVYEAWSLLEQAAGIPLLGFPEGPTAPAVEDETR